jgi:glutamate synthase domain-containing protein 1
VAHIKGQRAHAIVTQGLKILENLDHRGAVGADKLMGDGAGILIQIPDEYFRAEMAAAGVELPPPGEYGVGQIFLPKEHASRLACEQATRACSSPTSSANIIPTCTSRISRARWRWCISASRPTPSRPGRWRIPTAWSPITARSTRCAATSTGWRRGQAFGGVGTVRQDIDKLWPISYEGQSDTACFDNALEFLVQGGYRCRTRDDADSGSLGRQSADG